MNIKKLRIILAASFATVGLVSAILGFSGALNAHTYNSSFVKMTSTWMKEVKDGTKIREMDIPGSHDTMALRSIADLSGQCQNLTLKEQLELGVRFLDIRLVKDHHYLKAMHGFIDQKEKFDSISETVTSFLKKNPSEFIIMSIKEEVDPDKCDPAFEQTLIKYLDSDIYLKEQKDVPTYIEEVRGKVLILSRYKNPTIGIPAYDGWKDSVSFTLPNDIYVQDTYKIKQKEQKQDEIIKCFNETGHALKINFLSAYRTDGFPPSYAMSAAKDINPWINKEIDKYQDRNIVLYDFISEETMSSFFKEANK